MPRTRHASTRGIIPVSSAKRKRVTTEEKLAYLSNYGPVSDPTNTRAVNRQYAAFKKFPLYLQRKANKREREKLKERGFFVTQKGVIIDSPRDVQRKQIPGAKFSIEKDATIKWEVKRRTKTDTHIRSDYIIGLTKTQRKEFARDPKKFVSNNEKEFRAKHPKLKGKKIQVRLQWGAYQATKDFHPSAFLRTSTWEAIHKAMLEGKKSADKLVGLHYVAHRKVPLTGIHYTISERKRKRANTKK